MKKNFQAKKRSRLSLAVRLIAAGLVPAALATSFVSVHATGNEVELSAVEFTSGNRDYSWLENTTETYTYDFTDTTLTTYSKDEKLANLSLRTNMVFDGNTLSCKSGKTFSFGSAIFLGDDYGIQGGELSLDLDQSGGIFSIGVRLSKKAAKNTNRGVWFTTDGTGLLTINSPETNMTAQIGGLPTSGRITIRDKVDSIEFWMGTTYIARVLYESTTGAMSVEAFNGSAVGTAVTESMVQSAGYFTLFADSLEGTIDNVSFTHTSLARPTTQTTYSMNYGNWVATDDRDRTTPTSETTGTVNANKQVGVFYFINHTGNGKETPLDNTLLYTTLGLNGMKEHLSDETQSGAYYWAEPYFGYYLNTDAWVARKHAYMLEAAGVDFIFLDVSNGAAYPDAILTIFDTWKAIRDEGGSTPDICFLAHGKLGAVWSTLWDKVYDEDSSAQYSELFYKYKNKPLLLGDTSSITDATQKAKVEEMFTVRKCWAWGNGGANSWSWLQEYSVASNGTATAGSTGCDPDTGEFEQLALCMGHHPTSNKGRSFVGTPSSGLKDFGFSMDSGAGLGFAYQFKAIKYLQPDMLLITGWNEWTAGLTHNNATTFAGTAGTTFSFVDQFNTEFSRDGEPMKLRDGESVGFGDNYYYQMASYIREFKGWRSTSKATNQTTIQLGDVNAWSNVGPTFTDFTGDAEWRSSVGYFGGYTYVNNSGRNDLTTAKVSQDADYLYFLINTAQDLVVADDSTWMNLYLNVDGNNTNGWEGFDFVLNRDRDGHYVSVESLKNGWTGRDVGQALYTVNGSSMTIRVSKDVLGLSGTVSSMLFKWADNSTSTGNVMEFMDLGDTAPNDRYAFRYLCSATPGATSAVTYSLKAADGSSVDLRDEAQPLPEHEEPPVVETEDTEPANTEPETTEPEVTEPETTEPETTEPETTEPQETEPRETEPVVTDPEDTEPGDTDPQDTEPDDTDPQDTKPDDTDPEDTDPEDTDPEDTDPEETKKKPNKDDDDGDDDDDDDSPEEKGCDSMVSSGLIAIPAALFAGWALRRKKED